MKLRSIVLMFCVLLVAGCNQEGAEPSSPKELVVWHSYRGAERAALEKVIDNYNRQQGAQGYHVRSLAIPFDAYRDKLNAAIPRGKGPDIFLFGQDRLGGWVEVGNMVEPLDFYITPQLREAFLPRMMESLTIHGITYGLPLNFKTWALIYNKALISTPPKTSTELVEEAARLKRDKGVYGLAYEYTKVDFHAALMNAFDGGVLDDKGQPTFDLAANADSLNLLLKWINRDHVLVRDVTNALAQSLFNTGKVAMVMSGPWFLGEVRPSIQVGVTPLPFLDEVRGQPMRPWLIVEGAFVAASSKHKKEAFDLGAYLVSPAAAKILALEGRQLPARRDLYQDTRIVNDPIVAGFKAQLEHTTPIPSRAEMALVWSPMEVAMKKAARGAAPPQEALAEAQKAMLQSLADLRRHP